MQPIADIILIIGLSMIALGGAGVIKNIINSTAEFDPTEEGFTDDLST